ncbi:MAG: SagB/ThcOx family dehydrogenase [Clostridia bacterium]
MKNIIVLLAISLIVMTGTSCSDSREIPGQDIHAEAIPLQEATIQTGGMDEWMSRRRSVRDYADVPATMEGMARLLWAAQGVTSEQGYRTIPSAGALHPLVLYVAAIRVEGLEPGIYRYDPGAHSLLPIREGDFRSDIAREALNQDFIRKAPATILISAAYETTTSRYGERGIRYVHMEAGHASQNIYLMAESMGWGTVAVGAFNDEGIKGVFMMSEKEIPLYLMPAGIKP